MHRRRHHAGFRFGFAFLVGVGLLAAGAPVDAKATRVEQCPWKDGVLVNTRLQGEYKELIVSGDCTVPSTGASGRWVFGNVHIIQGGTLRFSDATIHFWTTGILVEKGGTLEIGAENAPVNGAITIHLYGEDETGTNKNQQGKGILCRNDHFRCGVPKEIWESNVAA